MMRDQIVKQNQCLWHKVLTSVMVVSFVATASWSQTLTWLGTLPGGGDSFAYDVSADGRVVVGWAYNSARQWRAFRWQNGVMQELGTLGGDYSRADSVSADGRVVVGHGYNSTTGEYRAFRWQNGVMQDLGTLGGRINRAFGVSADGSVVVGDSGDIYRRAFRWQNGVMQDLGTLPGGDSSYAIDVSADGRVVVGTAANSANDQVRVFRWENGVMQDLGTLSGSWSYATAVSANGRVVVGYEYNRNTMQWRAFRWENGTMRDLGTLPDSRRAYALDVSATGRVVVGGSSGSSGDRAVRWTLGHGIEDLNITYSSLLTDGSVLYAAEAISPNGRYIVGIGFNATTRRGEAFLLDTGAITDPGDTCPLPGDVNDDGRVDDADLLIVLFNFGRVCR